jgi:predicted O-methyltransferase YrrM
LPEDVPAIVDDYLTGLFVPDDPGLDGALAASKAAGLPDIQVSPVQGKLLHLLARLVGARSVLEFGTLGGYSTIWMARALPPDGRLVTCEIDPRHAAVARDNVARAGLSTVVDIRVGPALETLDGLEGPFDLVFIDADKENNAAYVRRALALTRAGGVIVVDNVIRHGRVADPANSDPRVTGSRDVLELIAAEPRLDGTALQTVGGKGHDGFALALVTT